MPNATIRSRTIADNPPIPDEAYGLAGKIVVVTGAGGGIGRAVAQAFQNAGARLAIVDREAALCAPLLEQLGGEGPDLITLGCDVADPASVAALADAVQRRLGPADVLVNNAAMLVSGTLIDLALEDWNRLLSVNLTGYFLCAQAFGRQMMTNGGGVIVHTGSVAGNYPQSFSGSYSIAKAGVAMLSQLLAVELGEYGIRSNIVSPAMVRTPMSEGFYLDPVLKAKREAMVPSGRIGVPQDIAEAILWLASPRSSYVNGVDLAVDGALPANLLRLIPRPGFEK